MGTLRIWSLTVVSLAEGPPAPRLRRYLNLTSDAVPSQPAFLAWRQGRGPPPPSVRPAPPAPRPGLLQLPRLPSSEV